MSADSLAAKHSDGPSTANFVVRFGTAHLAAENVDWGAGGQTSSVAPPSGLIEKGNGA